MKESIVNIEEIRNQRVQTQKAIDTRKDPNHYPWEPTTRIAIIGGTPILSVSENRNTEILKEKFCNRLEMEEEQLDPIIIEPVTVKNINVGFSPVISHKGYIGANPYHDEGNEIELSLLWIPEKYLQALDSTEPNYTRKKLSCKNYPIQNKPNTLEFWIYDHGKLYAMKKTNETITLCSQQELHRKLSEEFTLKNSNLITT